MKKLLGWLFVFVITITLYPPNDYSPSIIYPNINPLNVYMQNPGEIVFLTDGDIWVNYNGVYKVETPDKNDLEKAKQFHQIEISWDDKV